MTDVSRFHRLATGRDREVVRAWFGDTVNRSLRAADTGKRACLATATSLCPAPPVPCHRRGHVLYRASPDLLRLRKIVRVKISSNGGRARPGSLRIAHEYRTDTVYGDLTIGAWDPGADPLGGVKGPKAPRHFVDEGGTTCKGRLLAER